MKIRTVLCWCWSEREFRSPEWSTNSVIYAWWTCIRTKSTRSVGIYTPESRSLNWDRLSRFISRVYTMYGDFNVNLERDGIRTECLLDCADAYGLALTLLRPQPHWDLTEQSTSHSWRKTWSKFKRTLETRPVITARSYRCPRTSANWNVFTLFSEFAFAFWEVAGVQTISMVRMPTTFVSSLSWKPAVQWTSRWRSIELWSRGNCVEPCPFGKCDIPILLYTSKSPFSGRKSKQSWNLLWHSNCPRL